MLNPQSAIRNPKSRGFTLIEIVITIVLVSILAGIAAVIIAQGARGYSDEKVRSDVHYQARLAVERMAREIRLIRAATATDIPTMNGTTLMYTDVDGTQMGFQLTAGAIQRTQNGGGTWQTLASNITGGTIFAYFDTAGAVPANQAGLWYVEIDVTSTLSGESLQIRSRVHPRNF